jgi:hypothetical protein
MKLRIFNNVFIVLVFAFIVSIIPSGKVSAYTYYNGGLFLSVNGISDSYYTNDQHIAFSTSTYYSADNDLIFELDGKVCIMDSNIPCANPWVGSSVRGGYDIQASSALAIPQTPGQYSIYAALTYTLPNYNVVKINDPDDTGDDEIITGFYTQLLAQTFIEDTYADQSLYKVVSAPSPISSPDIVVKTFNVVLPPTLNITATSQDGTQTALKNGSITVQAGENVKITWITENTVSCKLISEVNGVTTTIMEGADILDKEYITPVSQTTKYTVDCKN